MLSPAPLPPREGDLVAGKYRVERLLGAGGMGMVFAARHEQLDQPVALKVVLSGAVADEEGAQRFMREARAAARLKSEHVARVLDVGTLESGSPYMVMELLEGSDLAGLLAANGPFDFSEAADWVLQACEAIAEAHAAGIVHRDIKPENLFLARTVGGSSHIKVLDFGISKSVDSSRAVGGLTRTQSMLGSPLYMSPEQMRSSRDVDPRTDVWALGVVLFELVSGTTPFNGESMPELCLKVVSEPPRSLAALRPDVPAAMVEIVERCLDKDPQKRFANAAELAVGLESLVSPAARSLVDRARLASGRASTAHLHPTPPRSISTPLKSNSTSPTAPTLSLGTTPPLTPDGWRTGTPPEASPAKVRATWPRAVAIACVVVIGLVAILLGTSQRWRSSSPTAAVAVRPATASVVPSPPPAAVAPSAIASAGAAPSAGASARAAPSADVTAAPSAVATAAPPAAAVPPRGAQPVAARPSPVHPQAKPAVSDDDIPTLR